jgi:hypothetical protein
MSSYAADLDIGTHASFYSPPEGGGNTAMVGVDATYRLNNYFSARGSVDNANYRTTEHQYSLTSYTLDMLLHLMGAAQIDPYVGLGGGLNEKQIDGFPNSTTLMNALAGVTIHFPTFNAGVEIKYTIPDTRYMDTGFYSAGGNMTGGMHLSL